MGRLPNGEEVTDTEMMQRPDDWPMWPYLPVKRGPNELGSIVDAMDGLKSVVYLGNMYAGINVDHNITYETFEAITDDGWRVD